MTTRKRINHHKELAIKAMEENDKCRNDDLELLFHVFSNKGIHFTDIQKLAIKSSGVEIKTLFRQRQRIQAEGKFLPTNPETLKKRRKLAAYFAEYYTEL